MGDQGRTGPKIHKKLNLSGALQHVRRIFQKAKEISNLNESSSPPAEQVFTETWAMWPRNQPKPDELLERALKTMQGTTVNVSEYDGGFDESCGWPRRLLHVPTMTSLEWRPGNEYGGIKEPGYTAISYTWGRFKLRGDDRLEVKAVDIKGISWAVPRIDPEHFLAEAFEKMIRLALLAPCWNIAKAEKDDNLEKHAVEFVWVDVACIDQEDRYIQMREVGRQVAIFKQAKIIAMWLSSLWDLEIQPQYSVLQEVGTMLGATYVTGPPVAISSNPFGAWELFAEGAFRDVMCDPWFSSLWTLQEAFIGLHNSVFLSQSGTPIFLPDEAKFHISSPFNLVNLGILCYNISHFVGATSHLYENNQRVLNVMKYIRESGILSVFQSVEMGTFLAARHRKSTRQEDKIYGIMQVFDVRVGLSRPDAQRGHTFTVEELEDELGLALMQKDQIMAQLFLFNEPAPYGKAWRPSVGKCSILTGAENKWAIGKISHQYGGETVLSTKVFNGFTWGYFEGCLCSFGTLLGAAQMIDANFILSLDAQPTGGGDKGKEPTSSTGAVNEFQTTSQARDARESLRQAAASAMSKYNTQDLFILRLSPGFDNHSWGIALVRQRDTETGFEYYHRLGICEYQANSNVKQAQSIFKKPAYPSRLAGIAGHLQSNGKSPGASEACFQRILRGGTNDWVRCEGYWG